MNIVLIGLLGSLLSSELNTQQKLDIMENEYEIPVENTVKKEVSSMCNLGEGIWEKAIMQGRTEGRAEEREKHTIEVIMRMNQKVFLNQISDVIKNHPMR